MAVLLQALLCMTALTSEVTYVCPQLTRFGGCSLLCPFGITHETFGSVLFFASV